MKVSRSGVLTVREQGRWNDLVEGNRVGRKYSAHTRLGLCSHNHHYESCERVVPVFSSVRTAREGTLALDSI